ncbi:hypothetical protein E3N88_14160 [Mikania micrantha]|uniref:Uncharacterized protein n=1 Tax=Mikania micrantha TaxID=192012 RepID=A0A5N6P0L8_9ASTR|nr:hypothetical protein E3N88_14160 [Mikania micrantha]
MESKGRSNDVLQSRNGREWAQNNKIGLLGLTNGPGETINKLVEAWFEDWKLEEPHLELDAITTLSIQHHSLFQEPLNLIWSPS